MKKQRGFIAAGAFAVLGLAASGGWFYWTTTPGHSLTQFQAAAQAGDLDRVETLVDIDRTIGTALDELWEKVEAAERQVAREAGSGLEALGVALMGGVLDAMRPTLEKELAKEVRDWVRSAARGSMAPADAGRSDLGGWTRQLQEASRARLAGVGRADRNGRRARLPVRLHYPDLNATLTLGLEMERDGRRWRVVGVEGVGSLLSQLEELEWERLQEVNDELREKLNRHVHVEEVRARVRTVATGWFTTERRLEVHASVRNVGSEPLREIALEFFHPTSRRSLTLPGPATVLEPGTGTTFPGRASYEGDELQRALVAGEFDLYETRLRSLQLQGPDGDWRTMALYQTWSEARLDLIGGPGR